VNFPSDIEEKLGFDQIRALVYKQTTSAGGKLLVERMQFSDNYKLVELWLEQVEEFRILLQTTSGPIISHLDVSDSLKKLEIKDNVLAREEMLDIRQLCEEVRAVHDFFEGKKESFHKLSDLVQSFYDLASLIQAINQVFDKQGEWKNNASKKLHDVLEGMKAAESEVHSVVQELYRKASNNKWTPDTEVTVKNGRLVIPVFAEHKRKMQGVVHDESGGGKILYIEPLAVLEQANRYKELAMERDREMKRILKKLTQQCQPHLLDLKEFAQKMAVLDFIRAKARVAIDLNAALPLMANDPSFDFRNLFHPLLYLSHMAKKKPTMPMSLVLDDSNRMVIISGPNAGGKSICIKTVALNQYMLQTGLLIPCDSDSTTGFFSKIFVDIGDNQSIENDLSSYSSHLTAMKQFLLTGNAKTLVLIDEIGSGTDPNFGGAMAEAILVELAQKRVRAVVTTHFGNVKSLSDKTDGMINASMMYDVEKLKPLFQLLVGKPGSSFALEVAQNIGLPKHVIHKAKQRSNTKQQKTDELLAKLEIERQEIQASRLDMEVERVHLQKLRTDYQQLKDGLGGAKTEVLNDAKLKALQIIENANKAIEKTIKDLVNSKGDKQKIKQVRSKLDEHKKSVSTSSQALKPSSKKEESKSQALQDEAKPVKQAVKIEVGTVVRIPNSSSVGEVIEIRKNKAVVVAGIIKSNYLIEDLEPANHQKTVASQRTNIDFVKRQSDFKMTKDVRGMRGTEAIQEIDKWIENAVVIGSTQLRLIHGKGDGILKKLIRDYYHKNPLIKRISYEDLALGGEGVSLIELK
jgi:DNA mismatch repair protein MutS2